MLDPPREPAWSGFLKVLLWASDHIGLTILESISWICSTFNPCWPKSISRPWEYLKTQTSWGVAHHTHTPRPTHRHMYTSREVHRARNHILLSIYSQPYRAHWPSIDPGSSGSSLSGSAMSYEHNRLHLWLWHSSLLFPHTCGIW